MPKLTKRVVEAAKPAQNTDVFLWDTVLPGFGLRVYPSGRRKYLVQYRTKERRQRRVVLGAHGTLTAEEARDMAGDMLAQVRKGEDPAGELQAARQAPKVCDLADEYLERHAIPNKRPASVAADRSMLDRIVLPRLGLGRSGIDGLAQRGQVPALSQIPSRRGRRREPSHPGDHEVELWP
ncbi:MAG: DUF4102 domain-containing protein [Proteobacteria bacterium]|nr:DUF4102 domain-containing protein [Pseudomonadota bacterium]